MTRTVWLATRQSDSANSLMICLAVSTQYRRVTDRQTSNRQTFCDMIVCDSCTTLNRELSGCYVVYTYTGVHHVYTTLYKTEIQHYLRKLCTLLLFVCYMVGQPPPPYIFSAYSGAVYICLPLLIT